MGTLGNKKARHVGTHAGFGAALSLLGIVIWPPGGVRTPDPQLRRLLLYPTELRAVCDQPVIMPSLRRFNAAVAWHWASVLLSFLGHSPHGLTLPGTAHSLLSICAITVLALAKAIRLSHAVDVQDMIKSATN